MCRKTEQPYFEYIAFSAATVVLCLSEVCFHSRLISDHINHFEKKRNIIKSLEGEWHRSVKLKHQREEEERRFLRCVDVGSPYIYSSLYLHSFILIFINNFYLLLLRAVSCSLAAYFGYRNQQNTC